MFADKPFFFFSVSFYLGCPDDRRCCLFDWYATTASREVPRSVTVCACSGMPLHCVYFSCCIHFGSDGVRAVRCSACCFFACLRSTRGLILLCFYIQIVAVVNSYQHSRVKFGLVCSVFFPFCVLQLSASLASLPILSCGFPVLSLASPSLTRSGLDASISSS